MWPRLAASRLRDIWTQFPATMVIGARQVGKTTLARGAFPEIPYCDLEEPNLRQLFQDDPAFQIGTRATSGRLILDEAQSVSELFSALRGIIDQRRSENGRFLILGSAQPALIRQASESLAGRVGILEMDPLTALEASRGEPLRSMGDVWLRGGFPDALRGSHREWWEAYLRTYVERDLPHLGLRAEPLLMRRLLTMLAHCQGGILNASQLGGSLGVSYHTVQRYLDLLERTFLVRRLPPYFRNVGKRLTKSPKIYLRDTGLLHHLLNITTHADLDNHPIRGASWETFVLEDLLRRERLRHPHSQAFFWRTAAGAEVDLVIDRGSARFAVEIKAGHASRPGLARALELTAAEIGAERAWIIDQAEGVEPLRPNIERRGMAESCEWLPS